MVSRTRDEIYEDAAIESELEEFFDDEAEVTKITAGAESSKWVKDISNPTRLVTVYLVSTGEPRHVPAWTLQGKNSILRRRTQDGQREFATKPPAGKSWEQGTVMCLLHPDHPRRAEFDAMGLLGKTCGALTGKHAGHLASEFALDLHMEHRHAAEWATIQRHEARMRDQEYRDFQRLQSEFARSQIEANQGKGKKASE